MKLLRVILTVLVLMVPGVSRAQIAREEDDDLLSQQEIIDLQAQQEKIELQGLG